MQRLAPISVEGRWLICVLLFGLTLISVKCEPDAPMNGHRSPSKGSTFHACLKEAAQGMESTGHLTVPQENGEDVPISSSLNPEFSERVASQLSDKQVADFCQAAQSVTRQLQQHVATQLPPSPGRTVRPLDFTDWQNDPTSTLFLPHAPQYVDNTGAIKLMMVEAFTLYDNPDASPISQGSNSFKFAAKVATCQAAEVVLAGARVYCAYNAAPKTWQGTGEGAASGNIVCDNPLPTSLTVKLPTLSGTWNPVPTAANCSTTISVLEAALFACTKITESAGVIDGTVSGARLNAVFENGRKTMDNQLIIWRRMVAEFAALTKTTITLFDQLSKRIDDVNTLSATQNCDTKTRIADLQREVNYLRYLLLTPAAKRPRFAASTEDCILALPEYCERPVTQKSAMPAAFDSQPGCVVSDGVREFDLDEQN